MMQRHIVGIAHAAYPALEWRLMYLPMTGPTTIAPPLRRPDSAAAGEDMLADMRVAAEKASALLRSIGSPYRLMILCLLVEGEQSVTDICANIGARQSLTSQHLTRLRLDGLVKVERRGHFAYYSLADTVAKEIGSILHRHYCADGSRENGRRR
jgi:ArsR family transcriptional regulator, virulence genes transcriptional regulator